MSDSVQPHRRQPTRLPCPWDSPGKNTGVGCHFLLQCMKVKSESEVAQLCPTLRDAVDCSPPGSSIHGIFQARVLERGAIPINVKKQNITGCLFHDSRLIYLLMCLFNKSWFEHQQPDAKLGAEERVEQNRIAFYPGGLVGGGRKPCDHYFICV